MPLTERKKFHWGYLIIGLLLAGILVIAFCDFAPKQTTEKTVIQHTID